MPQYELAVDSVMLREQFGPESPVYVWLQATVYDPGDPDTGLWAASVGGLSPTDANVPTDPNAVSADGLFSASSLPPGVRVRHDDPDTGWPTFRLPPIPLQQGQRVAAQLIVAPQVWFQTVHVPPDALDRAAMGVFIATLGSVAGPVGNIAGFILGELWGGGGTDPDVPCFNPILSETLDWDQADLERLVREQTHEYGPTGAPASFGCPRANASYWLAFARAPEFQHVPGCLVRWIDENSTPDEFAADWGDYGVTSSDQVNAWITTTAAREVYDVRIRERRTASADALAEIFEGVPVTEEPMIFFFYRNVFAFQPFGYRRVRPYSAECSSFTNINPAPPWVDALLQLQSLSLLSERWRARLPAQRLPLRGAADDAAIAAVRSERRVLEQSQSGPYSDHPNSRRDLEPRPSGREPLIPRTGIFRRFRHDDATRKSMTNVRVLRLDSTLVLMLFGEFHSGRLLQRRIRFLRTDAAGNVRTDVLLRPTYPPPR